MIARNMLTFAHRSLLAVLFLLVLAPPAGAAEVARNGDDSLDVRDDRGPGICLRVMQRESGGGTCERAPLRARRSALETFGGGGGWRRAAPCRRPSHGPRRS